MDKKKNKTSSAEKDISKSFYINDMEHVICEDHIKKHTISRKTSYTYSFKVNNHNMKSLKIKIDCKGVKKGFVLLKMANELNELVVSTCTDIREVGKDSWIEFNFPAILTHSNKYLTLIVEFDGDKEIALLLGRRDLPCVKYTYEKLSEEIEDAIERYTYRLDEIYNSSGWKVLAGVYKFRDKVVRPVLKIIKKPFKVIKFILKLFKPSNIKNAAKVLKNDGFKALIRLIINKSRETEDNRFNYELWLKTHDVTNEQIDRQRDYKFDYEPKISILVPTYNTPENFLVEMIESVNEQTYTNWELCIADASNNEETRKVLARYEGDPKIPIKYLDENKGISGNTNEAATLVTGEYIALFDHDDLLMPNALFEIVKVINKDREVDFIYTDEDKTDETSTRRFDPHFKPDFAIDTFRSNNYICHFTTMKRELFDSVGGFRKEYDGAQDFDLFLRTTEKAKKIVHIPKVVYHWRVHQNSTAGAGEAKLYAFEAGKNAIQDSLDRNGIKGTVEMGKYLGIYNIRYELESTPLVSILIPTKDHIEDLDRCIKSIIEKSTYKNYEIIVIENNSTESETFKYYDTLKNYSNIKVVEWKDEFNYSAINNFGVKNASGEVFLLLNNDVEVINGDWIERMLQYAQREDVGAVGAKLYYPNDTIQHGGVIVGLGGIANHAHKHFHREAPGYFARLNFVQNFSAVTAACLMVRRDVYEKLNGLDEDLKVAFNDVDFCLRIRALDKLIVWTPFAELYHHESISRGVEDTPEKIERFKGEIRFMEKRWGKFIKAGDPYYNPNLTMSREDYSLNFHLKNS
ncbi:glycosyltransferase family 2 protein [Clostridium cellulovorans]|uniref:Glycosyl transferase family 2 n=2 Tax=Clostridium cellulovorans TaxID=1493 RepID=D9SRL4_CLOC7|nr:glycosyltransferase family 2 protein [Clostridium cellulovorans]ADL50381.1 glycosyl transferase family 2 [Clostridium cellulovorans 743B]BAV13183.1 glycosyl transferase [Clostridium cellulovorans]